MPYDQPARDHNQQKIDRQLAPARPGREVNPSRPGPGENERRGEEHSESITSPPCGPQHRDGSTRGCSREPQRSDSDGCRDERREHRSYGGKGENILELRQAGIEAANTSQHLSRGNDRQRVAERHTQGGREALSPEERLERCAKRHRRPVSGSPENEAGEADSRCRPKDSDILAVDPEEQAESSGHDVRESKANYPRQTHSRLRHSLAPDGAVSSNPAG